MSLAALLPDTPGLVVEQVLIGKEAITLVARLTAEIACCPCCAQPSSPIHSYARRTLLDRPISGRRGHLSLQVRRFRCGTPSCPRRTFREQVPSLAARASIGPSAFSKRCARLPSRWVGKLGHGSRRV
jgi:transposase